MDYRAILCGIPALDISKDHVKETVKLTVYQDKCCLYIYFDLQK